MIDDELRSVGPAPLTDHERDALRADLLAVIHGDEEAAPAGSADGGRRFGRRAVALGIALGLAGSASVAAAYVGLAHPDPREAATVIATSKGAAAGHTVGWRPELDAESAWCRGPAGTDDAEVYASDGPLDGVLERADLVAACRAKVASLDGADAGATTAAVCRSGLAGAPAFASPTILLGTTDCPSAGLAPLTDADLEALNEARAAEVSIRAIADPCPSRRAVLGFTRHQVEQAGVPLTVVDRGTAGRPPKVCFGTYVDWVAGTATVDVTSTTD